MSGKKISIYGLFVALAFTLSFLESLIALPFAIPGVKLGLTNLVVLVAFYKLGPKDAFLMNIIRILLVGLTFGNVYSFLYSIAGGMCSFFAMYLIFRCGRFGTMGVSVLGGTFHNLGQLVVAFFVLRTKGIFAYLPVLLIAGVVAGTLIGLLSAEVIRRLGPIDLDGGGKKG